MCGIAGYLSDGPQRNDLVLRMCREIAHRGPDGEGAFCDTGVALGHRRLSIIDLAGGSQPLGNEDGSVQVTFNGEIYNYQPLRAELIRKGHHFRTNSDTEVLVHLYEEVGERMPEHLNGMFAFAIWDGRRRELFLARDRFGKKPIYYSGSVPGTRFCFASELKALTVLPGFDANISARSMADFLSLDYVPDPQTIYEGVLKLPAAHSLTVTSKGDLRLRRYWEPKFAPDDRLKLDDAVAEIRELADDCVRSRMMSDVPLGAFLSGGVDSSAAVAYMSRHAHGRVKTFSIGFTDKAFDELEYARVVAERYETEHREEVVTPSVEEMLDKLVFHFDEPFADASAIPTLYLSRMTRRGVTVALAGDGADEAFGGYRRYSFGVLEHHIRAKFPDWFRTSVFSFAGRYYPKLDFLPRVFRAKTLLSNLACELGDAYFTSMSAFRDGGLNAILSPAMRQALGGYSPRDDYRARFRSLAHLPPLQQMQAVDLDTYLSGDILVKADRASMAYSLEVRAPWLDYRLVELAQRLPMAFLLQGQTGKFVFKKAMAPHVPERLLWRPKMGFATPLGAWFRTSLKPVFESTVLSAEMEPYLSLAEARRIWEQHQSGRWAHEDKLWNLLMLACWCKRHYGTARRGEHASVSVG